MKLVSFLIIFVFSLTVFLPAEEVEVSGFIELLNKQDKLPEDTAWIEKMTQSLAARLRGIKILSSTFTLAAGIFPPQSDEEKSRAIGLFAGYIILEADESLRRGTPQVRLRNELRMQMDHFKELAYEGLEKAGTRRFGQIKNIFTDKIENAGRTGISSSTLPGKDIGGGGPSDYAPDILDREGEEGGGEYR